MNIYMVLVLALAQKPDGVFLRGKIRDYPNIITSRDDSVLRGILASGPDLTLLKAMDSVKDNADPDLARQVFGINPNIMKSRQTCTSLPEIIQSFFHRRVSHGSLRLMSYTRRKGSENDWIDNDDEISYDHYVPDCGPKYTQSQTNKTPIIKTTNGGYPIEEASVGNSMDTGPSENTRITLSCPRPYDIEKDIFEALGYKTITMNVPTVLNLGSIVINVDRDPVTWVQFKASAKGNAINKTLLQEASTGFKLKKKLLFFKSLGDTMIVYYWLWGCRSTEENIGLLTCDTVVALQADILSQDVANAFWLLNYINRKKKEEHISYVYVKDRPTQWGELFDRTKRNILARYNTDIVKFKAIIDGNLYISIGDEKNLRVQIEVAQLNRLILAIYNKMVEQRAIVNGFAYTLSPGLALSHPYQLLKRYDLLSFILGKANGGFNIVRSRKQFNLNDDSFLRPSYSGKNLESVLLKLKKDHPFPQGGFSGGRNKFYDYGPDLDDTDVEYFLRYPNNPDIVAIDNLKKFILTKFIDTLNHQIRKKHTISFVYKIGDAALVVIIKLINMRLFGNSTNVKILVDSSDSSLFGSRRIRIQWPGGDIEKHISEDLGSVYSDLTYEFYVNPDYSDENISSLCKILCKSIIGYALEIYTIIEESRAIQEPNMSPRDRITSPPSRLERLWGRRRGGSTKNRKKYKKLSNKVSKKNKRPIRGTRKIRN